jgi:hypothetical protein
MEEKTIVVPQWKQTMQGCGEVRYQVLVDGSSTLPDFIDFDELNRVITIQTTDKTLDGKSFKVTV